MHSLEPIAVVGLACRFPGAADAGQFWRNLVTGTESVRFFTDDELRAAGVPEEERTHPDYVPAAPVLPDPDLFDAGLFGMSSREAELCDPQFRVFLEICHSALENAGYDPFAVPDSVGVFASVGPNGYHEHQLKPRPDLIGPAGVLASTLNQSDYLSTLVAYRLGLRGPAVTVLTACSSTLVAVHLAAQALRAGECDSAVVGGSAVRVPVVAGHRWTPGGILTDDGHCRPFDAAASGTLWGSGAAAVILKRLDDAVADGDRIRAVLLGSAVNNDGADKVSFSAPSVGGQTEVIVEAMSLAGVSPAEVGLVEAHATGTALGDPVEIAALTEAYRLLDPDPPLSRTVLGAVKSNIGHLGAVAGIAGFVKTVLSLEAEAIPAIAHLREPNPLLELDETRFELARELRPWPRDPSRRRVAAVTSLGIGGTNAHAILAEAPVPVRTASDRAPRLVVWSARTAEGERRLRSDLAGYFAGCESSAFADSVATLQHGRGAHAVRGAVVGDCGAAVAEALSSGVITGTARDEPTVAYLFPGQGVGYPRMATGLYGTVRDFTVAMDECLELFENAGVPLYKQWAVEDDPAHQQPLLFSVGYSLAAMWRAWTGPPAAVLGHSLGELTAAAVAGVLSLPDAVRLVATRSSAMATHPVAGGMIAVAAGPDEVAAVLPEGAVISAVNGYRQVVVSGDDAALAELSDRLTRRDVGHRRTPAAAPFHHPAWAPAARAWADELARIFPAGLPAGVAAPAWYSGATGGPAGDAASARYPGGPATNDDARAAPRAGSAAFWTGQLTAPVRFHDALTALLDGLRPDVLLEAGPGGVLTGLARRHPALSSTTAVRSLGDRSTDHADLLDAAARLWVLGVPLNWDAAGQPLPRIRAHLPAYPYARTRYWADAVETRGDLGELAGPGHREVSKIHPPGRAGPAERGVSVPAWVEDAGPDPGAAAPGTRALVLLPDDPDDALRVIAAVQRAALQPVRVVSGDGYADDGHAFRVRPGEPGDLTRVLTVLAERDAVPDVVVHAAGYGHGPRATSLTERLDAGVLSLLAVARTVLGSSRWTVSPRVVLLTSRAVDVTGGESVDPARTALYGLFRTLIAESPQSRCTGLDADARVPVEVLAREIAWGRPVPVLALRGRRRWTPLDRAVAVPPATGRSVREEGVYLVTGGAGGLGLAVARGLADTGLRPRIAVLGRRDPETVDPAGLRAVRALGAQVRGWACDVTDPAALARTVDAVTATLGPVNGVFHLAGVAGDRMLAFRDRADAAAVLAPKTLGTTAIEEVFAGRPPLDFAVYFSSRAAVEGLVGGGDYAAANAYLDGASVGSPLARGRVLSIAWPVWRGAGMADTGVDLGALSHRVHRLATGAATPPRPSAAAPRAASAVAGVASAPSAPAVDTTRTGPAWERVMEAATDWALDEHRVGRVPLLPGTAYLDMILRAYREVVADASDWPLLLSDVVFRTPFFDQATRILRITFTPTGDAHDVLVASRRVDGDTAWTGHVSGRVGPATGEPAEPVDPAALRLRFDVAGELERPTGRGRLFTLGPRWRNITAVWASGDEKLLRVELPAAFRAEVADHVVHPALLDTVAAAVRGPGQASSVPFHYGRVVVHAPLPATFHAHVRRAPDPEPTVITGDIDLIADDGALLVRIERFTMLMIDEQRLRDSATPPPKAAEAPAPTVEPAPSTAPDPAGPVTMEPTAAVALMLGMLDADLVGPVHVSHGGRPVRPTNSAPAPAPPANAATTTSAPAHPATVAAPAATATSVDPAPVAPAPAEKPFVERLREVWAESLGIDHVDENEDFFDAGGNSLTALELAARIRGALGIELRIGVLLEARTFAELVQVLAPAGERRP